ncbi:MAG: CCA tRNA nucleotidyltransferase [Alphaproteobacteria bacterium]
MIVDIATIFAHTPLCALWDILAAHDVEARLVGGCVRDAILGIPPADIDLATPLPPTAVAEKLQGKVKLVPTGVEFGTWTLLLAGTEFQLTSLRHDIETDGRHAKVIYGQSWPEDAKRRDFTINALYANRHGEITDYVGGLEDLQQGVVRFIGDADQRIREDYLRMLRFIRFSMRFGRRPPHNSTIEAIQRHAPQLALLSGERIAAEMQKILAHPRVLEAVALMQHTHLWAELLPRSSTQYLPTLLTMEQLCAHPAHWLLRLAALLSDGFSAEFLGKAWHLSRQQQQQLLLLLTHKNLCWQALADAHGAPMAMDIMMLQAARGQISPMSLQQAMLALKAWQPAIFPLNGHDAMALGLQGQMVGNALKAVRAWWVEHNFQPNYQSCLEKLREYCMDKQILTTK